MTRDGGKEMQCRAPNDSFFRDVSTFPDFVVLGFANGLIDFGHGVEAAD